MTTVYDIAVELGKDPAKVKQALIDALHGPKADQLVEYFMHGGYLNMGSLFFTELARDFLQQAEDIENGDH